MPRIFIGNFDFEHRLARPKGQLPAKLDRINAELATSWLAIAQDGDYLWAPQPIEAGFFDKGVADGLPRVIPVVSLDAVPRGVECVPWGWTDPIRDQCNKHGWIRNDPPDTAVRAANSRRLSAALEQEWLVGPEFAGEATSIEGIERLLSFHDPATRWVIKAEFGMSGRERLIGSGLLSTADHNWIGKRLTGDGVVFFEPWVERLAEVGIQIDIPRQGDPQLIDITPMVVSPQGQYAGSRFRCAQSLLTRFSEGLDNWDPATEVALRAARRIQDLGYFGPLGIDAMRYKGADGMLRYRPLQDINARWTMGRLSLGWKRLLKSGEVGCWLHGPKSSSEIDARVAVAVDTLREFLRARNMLLSPGRETIVRAVFETMKEFSEEGLEEKFLQEDATVSRSTVYRTLQLMEEAGLIGIKSHVVGHANYLPSRTYVPKATRRIQTSPQMVGDQPVSHTSIVMINK